MENFNKPILFLVFNRPDETRRVFETIRRARPKQLFVAADGPRADRENEFESCREVREIINNIDWDCELKTFFRDQNLGCGLAVSGAITWFFEHVEQGIILEDDCLPNESFFTFCSELLTRYESNEKVMHISGNNFQNGLWRGDGSYYFSQFAHIWGWATWKRAWVQYDLDLKKFPDFRKKKIISKIIKDKKQAKFWLNIFEAGFIKSVDTWDYAWSFAFFSNNGYAILPNRNLVSNIGFGINATHTVEKDIKLEKLEIFKLDELIHPSELKINKEADKYTFENLFSKCYPPDEQFFRKIKSIIKNKLRALKKVSLS